jgi:proteasome lid subunit RPN8/RPN11
MPRISKDTLEDICTAARNVYPDEFIALVGSGKQNEIIDEIVMLPATFGDRFAMLRIDLIPVDRSVMGSVHSHPSRNAFPSQADLSVFKKTGKMHLIIAYPFSFESIRAFDNSGRELELEVVE